MCMHQLKLVKEKERKTFANMFDKFARIDAQKEEEARKRQMPLEINEWGEAGRNNNGNRNTAHEVLDNNQEIKTDNMEVVEDKQTA